MCRSRGELGRNLNTVCPNGFLHRHALRLLPEPHTVSGGDAEVEFSDGGTSSACREEKVELHTARDGLEGRTMGVMERYCRKQIPCMDWSAKGQRC